MNVTTIDTSPVRHRAGVMPKLTGLIFAALLLPAVPASAASFGAQEPAPVFRLANADANRVIDCNLPQLPLQIDTPLVLRPSVGHESRGDSRTVESRWTSGATSEWNAGMNRAVDRVVNPPENVNVYAVQTADHLNGSFEGTHGPDRTLAGFAIVIH